MATNLHSRPSIRSATLRTPLWLGRQLVSFEAFFLLFLYGVQIRQILPPIPGNEAYVFGAITIAMGGWIIIRDGLYLRGVPILLAGLAFTGWMVALDRLDAVAGPRLGERALSAHRQSLGAVCWHLHHRRLTSSASSACSS